MANQVAIIHGWSDSSKSFRNLKDYLVANGYDVAQVWLGDYVSLEDDVRVEDVGKRMHSVLSEAISTGRLSVPFDLIVHSTGGLVAREWIARFYPDGMNCPAKKIIMLAPANFGSRLASLGKSMIGRVAKGWNNWFQTGACMLNALELASPYQWNLARRDLLDPDGRGEGPYGADKLWPFVITGTRAYATGMRQIVNEDGSDGTVRVPAANLNASGFTIDFSDNHQRPNLRAWHWRSGTLSIPFAVLPDRDHGSIIDPAAYTGARASESGTLGQLVLEALSCKTEWDYREISERWRTLSERTAGLTTSGIDEFFEKEAPPKQAFHQYMQIVTRVRDDHDVVVEDYFLEFFSPEIHGHGDAVFFHKEVLQHVHVNSNAKSNRCLFVDRTDLLFEFYPRIRERFKRKVAVSISAAALGRNIRHFDKTKEGAKGHMLVHTEDEERRRHLGGARLNRNTTHLVDIVIPRQPLDRVFKMSND